MKANPFALGLTGGILLGAYVLGFTLLGVWFGYGTTFLSVWVPLHPGYAISYLGAAIGFVYGFVEGFFWLYVGGHIYNYFVNR